MGEIVVFRHGRVRKPIQSPANPLQLSGAVQPEQVFSRNSDAFDIAGPDEWEFARPETERDPIWPIVAERMQKHASVYIMQ